MCGFQEGVLQMSLSLSLLHAAQQSDLTGLSKLSLCLHLLVQCKMSQGYSSLHLLLNKGYGVTSDVSSILGKYILSLHPHTQHLCWFSHLCREMVPLAGEREFVYMSAVERHSGCRREPELHWNPVSTECPIIFTFFGICFET